MSRKQNPKAPEPQAPALSQDGDQLVGLRKVGPDSYVVVMVRNGVRSESAPEPLHICAGQLRIACQLLLQEA